MKEILVNQSKIIFLKGDITKQSTDAIVNAANSGLLGGGGVDGAIHRAGGPQILDECRTILQNKGRLPTGQAVITNGGKLPAEYVIHTVGPIYDNRGSGIADRQSEQLRSCYLESLKLAVKHGIKTISFPSISTGAYHYPLEEAAAVAIKAVKDFLTENTAIKEVYFVLFNDKAYEVCVNAAG